MHLMYTLNDEGKRIYTTEKVLDGEVTISAHPARFSPDDEFSAQRVKMMKRFAPLMDKNDKNYRPVNNPCLDPVYNTGYFKKKEQKE